MKRLTTAAVVIVATAFAVGAPLSVGAAVTATQTTARATTHASLYGLANSQLKREVLGFVNDTSLGDPAVGYPSWHFSLLTTVVYFALHVNSGDGALIKTDSGWNIFHSATMTSFVNTAHAAGTKVAVSLNLHDFSTDPNNQVCQGLTSVNAGHTIGEIVGQMTGIGIDGINIDYEATNTTCADGLTSRAELVSFTQNLRAAMPAGSYLLIDTYAGSAEDNLEFFDIAGLQPSVDAFFVMSYDSDFSNATEAPLNCPSYCFSPVSPLNTYRFNVTKSMSQYMAYMAPSKIILGQAYYGRHGCVTNLTDAHQSLVTGGNGRTNFENPTYLYTSTVRYQPGVSNFTSHRDPSEGVAEWDTWHDSIWGCNAEQYFDDSVSLSYKYDLVNTDDLRGVGLFTLDYGGGAPELWNVLATHFTLIPGLVGNLSACPADSSVAVSWTGAPSSGGPITSYVVTASPGGSSVSMPGNATFATVSGLTPGTAYTFTVVGINSSGAGVGATTGSVTPGSALFTSYLNWYDKASPGVLGDNIHLVNPGASASSGCVIVTGKAVAAWTANARQETYVTMPQGTIGGPVVVTVNSGPAVLASQRVQFNTSFNELWTAGGGQAATTSFFNWFDKASPGMVNDNIHVLNPTGSSANVIVSLPGTAPQSVTIGAGASAFVTFPAGTIGGPVMVSSTVPVLASERVQYYSTFNEVWATSEAQAATTSFFNWFDKASPGTSNDNIHLVNPGTTSATVTVSLHGASPQIVTVAPGVEAYVTFPAGTIGGPVVVSSTQPVLASQRVQYYQSFNEVSALTAAQAATTSYLNWYDKASPGMLNDNVHLLNPGTTSADVTVNLPGAAPQMVTVAPSTEAYVTFPVGTIGGPVSISSTQPVLASQRVQYYQTFNEIPAA
jgi:spore germination protein YaaH